MTIMNGNIRADLTQLLADHLNEQHCIRIIRGTDGVTSLGHFEKVAEDAMDFIYGSEDGDVPQPECEEPTKTAELWTNHQGPHSGPGCCDGFTCRCCPGSVDRLEGGPVGPNVTYGVMTPLGPLRDAFVYLGPPSRTEAYVPVPRSSSEDSVRSVPKPGSAVE